MKKILNSFIFKTIVSLLTASIMGFIIWFVYCYYDDVAKKGEKYNNNEQSKEIIKEDNEKEDSNEKIEFVSYDLKRTRIYLNNNSYVLNLADTDAGKVITFADKALIDYNSKYEFSYLVLDNLFVLRFSDKIGDSYVLIDDKLENILSFKSLKKDNYLYTLTKPIFDDYKYNFEVIKNKIYITYVMNDIDDNDIKLENYNVDVQFTYELDYENNWDYRIVSNHSFSDYLKDKD